MSDAIARQTSLCTFCPKMSRVACPVSEQTGSEAVTPWGLMTLLGAVREGRLELDTAVASRFWQCTGCLRCRTFCTHENDVPAAMAEARRLAMASGVAPAAAIAVAELLLAHHNPHGIDLAARQRALCGERPVRGARTLFFPGCEALVSQGEAVVDAIRVLEHLGFGPVALLEDAPCSGRPYHDHGLTSELRTHASRMAQRLGRFALVVSGSAAAVHAFRVVYPEVGAPVRARVVHFAELVVERMPAAPRRSGLRVAYHDPCLLGRGLGVYEPPRELLRRTGAEVLELFDNRAASRCCGAGFGYARVSPDESRGIATRRVADLLPDADLLASCGATCVTQLAGVSGKPTVDLATLVARSLGLSA